MVLMILLEFSIESRYYSIKINQKNTKMSKSKIFFIEPDDDNIRLDRWFKRHTPDLTHGQLQKLLREGQIRIDGKKSSASYHIKAGQELRLPPMILGMLDSGISKLPLPNKKDINDIRKMTIFEDDDVLILNKPHGLAVQGGTGIKKSIDSMIDENYRLVHRLDKDTGGILLIAKNIRSSMSLAKSFRNKDTEKTYWGITIGVPKTKQGTINKSILKIGEKSVVSDDPNAKSAITNYKVIDYAKDKAAFVEMKPVTGRTHQLRVHMESIGNPLLGDRFYAPNTQKSDILHLHARKLVIPHPNKGIIEIEAPLSKEMQKTFDLFGF